MAVRTDFFSICNNGETLHSSGKSAVVTMFMNSSATLGTRLKWEKRLFVMCFTKQERKEPLFLSPRRQLWEVPKAFFLGLFRATRRVCLLCPVNAWQSVLPVCKLYLVLRTNRAAHREKPPYAHAITWCSAIDHGYFVIVAFVADGLQVSKILNDTQRRFKVYWYLRSTVFGDIRSIVSVYNS